MKVRLFQTGLLLAVALLCSVAHGQGFPWDDFKPRTLKELVNMESDVEQLKDKSNVVFHASILSSRVHVTYIGTSRKISSVKKKSIRDWAKMMKQSEDYAERYESDFLFVEDSTEYWLPVQNKVSSYFEKELKKGDTIDLYLVSAGGIRTAGVWDWMLLVEEFQKREDSATGRMLLNNTFEWTVR
jgi:hypothetical protein